MDILQQLFSKNANEVIQSILLYLDFKSLHVARTVCKKWNEIICDLVWNSKKGRAVLKERRILKWKKDPNKVMSYDYSDQMIIYQNPWDAVAKSFAKQTQGINKGKENCRKSYNIIINLDCIS